MSFLIPHIQPLRECPLVARYDRFIADVEIDDGRIVKSHCVNPGRMEGLVRLGGRAWVSPAPEGSKRKLRYGEKSRIDLLLRGATDHLVEVKNCHLVYPDGRAYFPDSVSVRAVQVDPRPEGFRFVGTLPVDLADYDL